MIIITSLENSYIESLLILTYELTPGKKKIDIIMIHREIFFPGLRDPA